MSRKPEKDSGTPGIVPARISFDAEGLPHADAFGDRYHGRIGAAEQAQHVFLGGNGLPAGWAGAPDFTILETGFGLGNNFLASWQAWRDDPRRCTRLHYVAIELHPPVADDLGRCHARTPWPALANALQQAWPPLTPGLHRLDFDDGRVQLLLAFGEVRPMLRQLDLVADAVYLDGFAPARNPAMWRPEVFQALARRLRPGARAATWSVARELKDGLRRTGFELELVPGPGTKRAMTRARFQPRHATRSWRQAAAVEPGGEREAIVVGAGLAGAWAAWALARQGWQCTALDRHAAPAAEASGNPGGLFHATVHADDGPHARLQRAAALLAAATLRPWIGDGNVAGAVEGLLRLVHEGETVETLQARLRRLGLPASFVEALDAEAASALAGLPLNRAAWHFRQAGWVAPAALVAWLLQQPGVQFRGRADVASIHREGPTWSLLDGQGKPLASTSCLVLAGAAEAASLWPAAGWPVGRSRGQVSWWSPAPPGAACPRLPLAGSGYALALPDGGLLCGASAAPGDLEPALREADHHFNIDRLAALTGWHADPATPWQGRVGWRAQTIDRLPIVGAVPAAQGAAGAPKRLATVVREPGLFAVTALGSRGLTWGPLAGQVLAAWVAGSPMPVEAALRDALDPARWLVRAARRAAG